MAIDHRFLNNSKDRLNAVRRAGMQFVSENKKLSFGSAGAMLLAPAVFKNDNRGYFQTAAVTTPLLAAGTYAVPSVIGAFRSQFSQHTIPVAGQSVAQAWTAKKARYASDLAGMREATQDYASGSTPLNVMQDVQRRHFAGRMGRSIDLTQETQALRSHLTKLTTKGLSTEQLSYISSAIHAEKIHALSPSDLLAYQNSIGGTGDALGKFVTGGKALGPIAPELLAEELGPAIEAHMGNLAFVRGMRYRLTKMKNLVFTGEPGVVAQASLSPRVNVSAWGDSEAAINQLKLSHPDLYSEVQQFLSKSPDAAKDLRIIALEKQGQQIAALRYKSLTVPVVQPNGTVITGAGFRRTAVAQRIYTADHMFASDVYAFAALNRNIRTDAIREELKRANIIGGIEADEDFSTLILPEGASMVNTSGAVAVRSRAAVPSHLFGWTQLNRKTLQPETVGFNKLDAENAIAAQIAAFDKHGLTAMGPEAGVYKGRGHLKELEGLAAFGEPSREKQDPMVRAVAKNISFTKTPSLPIGSRPPLPIRDKLSPFFRTDYLETVAPHVDIRGVALRIAGVTGGEKTLFGDLPATTAGLKDYEETAIKLIESERGVSTIEARKAWMDLSRWLSDPRNLQAMRKLGTLGEGGVLMRNDLYGMGLERTVRYAVNKSFLGNWQGYLGQDIESVFKGRGEGKVLLGEFGGNPVTAGGYKNYIENIHDMGNGVHEIEVREVVRMRTGAKLEVGGIKGLMSGMTTSESLRIRAGLNRYYKAIGSGGYIPREVEGISVLHYSQSKMDPVSALMNTAGDTLRRLDETGELEQLRPQLDKLEQYGISYSKGDFVQKSAVKNQFKEQSLDVIEDMFAKVSERLRNGQMQGDRFMRNYAMSHTLRAIKDTAEEESYLQYAHHYASPRLVQAWNTTQWNVPRESKVTYDMLQQLSMKGYHGALGDIQSRLGYEGDLRMTRKMEQYLQGDASAITRTLKLEEGLNETGFLKKMSTPEGRAGTFFDEGFKRPDGSLPFHDNYLMELPDGTTVPVLGHGAFGGKTNRYGAKFSASEHEKSLMGLMSLYKDGRTPDEKVLARSKKEYLDSFRRFIIGKDSYLRADAIDEVAGLGQFIQTRASTLRYAGTNNVNPFEIGIGRDMVNKIKDKDLRVALQATDPTHKSYNPNAEDVYAAVTRHPVSDMPFVRVKIDPSLTGSNIIGMDEGMRALLMADDDQDMIWAFFMRRGRGGYEEARKAVYAEDVGQTSMLKYVRDLGNRDDPRHLVGTDDTKLKNILEELKSEGVWKPARQLDEAIRARSTAGSIGAFSNTLTEMMIGLEYNKGVTDPMEKRMLGRFFFDTVRQGPISAGKLKAFDKVLDTRKRMDKARALGINSALQASLDEGGEYGTFEAALKEMTGAAGNQAATDFLTNNGDLFKRFFTGISDRAAVRQAKIAFTTPSKRASQVKSLGLDPNLMAYAQVAASDAPIEEEVIGTAGRVANTAAQASAEALGVWNRLIAAGREAGGAFRRNKVGLVLGTGVAIAAAAGMATGTMEKRGTDAPSLRSAGVPDQAPGGAWEGSRASRPRRDLVESPRQMRTAMVAPIQETADLDVRIRAKDRSRAHETAKIMAQMATRGDSNVTINYSGQKRRSIRSSDRLRDAVEA